MGKNVAVFVDVANIFYAAKAAGVDIDYVTLLKSATAGRDFVRAYAYTGLDPDNENQRNFHSFLARNHYKVVSKDIRKYGDGKVKANLDIELVVDMMKTARNLDVAIVVSGDGDFAPAIRAVQEMGVRVEVISFRGNTSSDLIEVADLFTDITQLARVEKGSSRSGRRVASDGEEDLSMTEVPDKQTEGTGASRGRGRGRGRGRDAEPAAARASDSRNGGRAAAAAATAAAASAAGLTVLPGEKLSRAGSAAASAEPGVIEGVDEDVDATPFDAAADGGDVEIGEDGRRRRRRRGGRGRGRGRGREQEGGFVPEGAGSAGTADTAATAGTADIEEFEEDEEDEVATTSPGPRTTPFGSVWDSQLGVPSARPTPLPPLSDDEDDFDEPEIPEYLIAEQRRGQANRGGRAIAEAGQPRRPRRRAHAAAIARRSDRAPVRRRSGGINRYPTWVVGIAAVAAAGDGGRSRRRSTRARIDRTRAPGGRAAISDPWSEVPEELEEMLRAQLAQTPKAGPRPTSTTSGEPGRPGDGRRRAADAEARGGGRRRRWLPRRSAPSRARSATEAPAPKRRTTRTKAAAPRRPTPRPLRQ